LRKKAGKAKFDFVLLLCQSGRRYQADSIPLCRLKYIWIENTERKRKKNIDGLKEMKVLGSVDLGAHKI
jgi:hypothetical protein